MIGIAMAQKQQCRLLVLAGHAEPPLVVRRLLEWIAMQAGFVLGIFPKRPLELRVDLCGMLNEAAPPQAIPLKGIIAGAAYQKHRESQPNRFRRTAGVPPNRPFDKLVG